MQTVAEVPPAAGTRQLRHTRVQGVDEKHYAIVTLKLYAFVPDREFATHETTVAEVDPDGTRRSLVQPLIKRFFTENEALDFHKELLERFDEILNLKAPEKKPVPAKK